MDMVKRSAEKMIPEKIRRVTAVPTPSFLPDVQWMWHSLPFFR
jgi:hypothetical protein